MKRYIYRADSKQIIFHDDLRIVELNECGAYIFEMMCYGNNAEQISEAYSNEFGEPIDECQDFVGDFYQDILSLEIELTPAVLDSPSFNLHTPIVHIIQNCNSPCIMCDCWKTKGKILHSRQDLSRIHTVFKKSGARGVMVSGGEPLLHPEIKQIIGDLKHIGLEVYLNSNGILLRENMKWLAAAEVDELVISLDGVDNDAYKQIRGVNHFDLVCDSIKEFKAKSPETRVIIRSTLTRYLINNLKDLVILSKSIGVDHIGFSPLDLSSESFSRADINQDRVGELSRMLLPSIEELNSCIDTVENTNLSEFLQEQESKGYTAWGPDKILKCLKFYVKLLDNSGGKFSKRPCLFPYHSLIVDYDGSLKNCFYSKSFGNITDIENIDWSFKAQIDELEKSKVCENCRGKIFCDMGVMI